MSETLPNRMRSQGFHGDPHLMAVAETCLEHSDLFVETGTNFGSTTCYVANRFPGRIVSCDPNAAVMVHAEENLRTHCAPEAQARTTLYRWSSEQLMHQLVADGDLAQPTTFWLDAHGWGFPFPLLNELKTIREHCPRAYVLIDDCLVPDQPGYTYDHYDGMDISYVNLAPHLPEGHRAYHPSRPPYIRQLHVPGWLLVIVGDLPFETAGLAVREVTPGA